MQLIRRIILSAALVAGLYGLASSTVLDGLRLQAVGLQRPLGTDSEQEAVSWIKSDSVKAVDPKKPVPVEIFVMSKCPDAAFAVSNLILPLMANLSDSGVLTLKPTFIGTPDDSNAGMACKHGPDECLGDIIELCAYEIYKDEPKKWLGFMYCLGNDYELIPDDDFLHGCAKEFGLDFGKLENCASSEGLDEGIDLLRTSARRAIQLGIKTSCTVTVNEEVRCVRDNDEWKDCPGGSNVEDVRRDILKAYEEANRSGNE